jgi:hypothetical protein
MSVVVIVVILATVLFGKGKNSAGSGGAGVPRVEFGAQVQKLGATGQLTYTNGWSATAGSDTVAVYAGREAQDSRTGLFVILRRTGRHQRLTSLIVHGSGSLTLLRPAPPVSEQAASTETLHFVTANGGTGTLSLSGDSVKLSG